MFYGYCRVSSKTQLENYSLEQQESEILERYSEAKIYKEQFTAKTTDRPIFQALLEELKDGDTLVVTKLDRFCRSTKEGLEIIEQLQIRGIKIHILNMGLIENTAIGQLIVTNLLAFAEFERAMIIERTQTAKAIAKQNPDFREGRPKKFKRKALEHALALLDKHTYKEVSEMTNISISTLTRAKRKAKLDELDNE